MSENSQNIVAAVQLTSGLSVAHNLARIDGLLGEAKARGVGFALLPEFAVFLGAEDSDKLAIAETWGDGPMQRALADLAVKHGLWLAAGTLPIVSGEAGRVFNTLPVFAPDGSVRARYDKLHLFNFEQGSERYHEARTVTAGSLPVSVDTPLGKVGLSICYDLRFPELYRSYGTCAAMLLPAAFTVPTGRAHWHLLCRARAVENQTYVIAAAQSGRHDNGRQTYGHSLIVDPWGEVLAELPEGEGVITAEISNARLLEVRQQLPALANRRLST